MFSKKSGNKAHNKNQDQNPKDTPFGQQQYMEQQQQQQYMQGQPEPNYGDQNNYYDQQQQQDNQNMMQQPQQPQQIINNVPQHQMPILNNMQANRTIAPSQPPHTNKQAEPVNKASVMIYPIDSANVKILFDGYSKFVDGDYFADCTCTLIKGGPNIVVDTMTVWDEEKLVRALRNEGLGCDDIDFVICTHGHSDHTGCNHLFKNAIHIVGFSISHKDQYYLHPDFRHGEEFNIDPSTNAIKIIPTPGHTLQDVTILVYTNVGIIAITGDLFEKSEDLDNEYEWLQAGSDNANLQRRNRAKILEMADYIIPGHGPIFKVPDKYKKIADRPNASVITTQQASY